MKIQLTESELRQYILEAIEEELGENMDEGLFGNALKAVGNSIKSGYNNVAYRANDATAKDAQTNQANAQGQLDAANQQLEAYKNSPELKQAVESYKNTLIQKKAQALGIDKIQGQVNKYGQQYNKYNNKAQNYYNNMRSAQDKMNVGGQYEQGYQNTQKQQA